MEGYRQGRPGDEGKMLDLANMVFSMAHRPHDFAQLLPKVYDQPGFAGKHVLYEGPDGALLALVGLHVIRLRLWDQHLRCGLIGTVCVHPRERGRGHMKRLMPMAEEMARKQGCHLMLLGGQRQRYNHFGFERGGVTARLEISRANLRHTGASDRAGIAFLPLEQAPPAVLAHVYRLYQAQQMVGERTREQFARVLRSYDGQGYAVMKGAQPLGYLYAAGGDWQELALPEEALPDALAAWQNAFQQSSTRVVLGLHQLKLLRKLGDMAEGASLSDSMMIRVLDWQQTLQQLLSFRHQVLPLPAGSMTLDIEGQRLQMQVGGQGAQVKPSNKAAALSLSHHQAVTRLLSLSGMWQKEARAMGAWFPLWLSLPMADGF